MQDETAKTLLATFRRIAPASIRAYTSDDEFKDIAVPTRRRKWAQVLDTIDKLAWSRLELLNPKGALMGTVENSEAPTELQDLGDGSDMKLSPQFQAALAINSLMLKAQEKVLSYRDKETVTLLSAQGEVLREMAAGMREVTALYREQVKVARENAETVAATTAAANDSSEIKQLLEAAPLIVQLLPVLKGLLTSGAAADVPPNGAKKH